MQKMSNATPQKTPEVAAPGKKYNEGLGILFIILASLLVAVMSALFKNVATEVSTEFILFWQSFVCLLRVTPHVIKEGGLSALKTSRPGLHLLRSVCGAIAFYCFFHSIHYISLFNAVLLLNTAPIFIPIVGFIWGGTKINHKLWWGLSLGFIGTIIILKPGLELLNPGSILGLLSGMFSAIGYRAIRRLVRTDPPYRIIFYCFLLSSLLYAPSLYYWQPLPFHVWAQLIGLGILVAMTQQLTALSLKHGKSNVIIPFTYTGVIFSGLIVWIVWGDVPDLFSVLGTIAIVTGVVMTTFVGQATGEASTKKP